MKLIDAKCPNCKAMLKIEEGKEKVECEYCHHTILVEDAVATYKLKVSGAVSVEGIQTNSDLISAANELLDMGEYLKAKKNFLEFSEKCPDKYQGWLGLLICRTRNFKIRDNNIMFTNDVNKYYSHFLRTAPDDVKKEYLETIDRYMYPERFIQQSTVQPSNVISNNNQHTTTNNKNSADVALCYVFGILFFWIAIGVLPNIISSLFWILSGLVLLPPTYNYFAEKIPFLKKNTILVRALLIIATVLIWGITALDYVFVGTWLAEDNTYVKITDESCSIGTYEKNNDNIKLSEQYTSEMKHEYEDDIYTIDCGSNYKFRYANDKFCLLENNECSKTYIKSDKPEKIIEKANEENNNTSNDSEIPTENNESQEESKTPQENAASDKYYELKYNSAGEYGKLMEYEGDKEYFYYFPNGNYTVELTRAAESKCFLWVDYNKGSKTSHGTAYNNKTKLQFNVVGETNDVSLTNDVHIYNSNNCDYKLTKKK